ncbi:VPLPA-CTERM sorting domain-containing protein [Methylicorpusculum oleiharenae]|uniref:VPLPA-CTERM sorting domain-containing protein n=1 Tax=Methylicorpusculum oleiharenae TaxID=1338687 RepID=UPI0019CFE0E5|nr:VPLPA-CTERM sorting domain-containing protein [Methylicorpusculum oleiharenae]MCD2452538.1 VPLPA-CTERM sorting domain-containing protein [Methylicorpusculum oleiharenae]
MTTKLAKAVSMAIAGSALTIGSISSASAHTMYNTEIRTGVDSNGIPNRISGTDGFVYGFQNANYPNVTGWVGTGTGISSNLPFNYSGKAHLNWAAELHHAGSSLEISKADALTRYGSSISDAEIDTGAGAWQDAGIDGNGNPTVNGPTGWKHQTDIGLIKAEETMFITLKPSVVTGTGFDIQNFGITVFTGMDKNTGDYSHHGSWNCPGCLSGGNPAPKPYDANDPFGTQGLTYLIHDATVDGLNGLTFKAVAGQEYSVYIGGAGVGRWNANVADYKLEITTSAVPIPAAVWLMGSGLVGLMSFGRKKEKTA